MSEPSAKSASATRAKVIGVGLVVVAVALVATAAHSRHEMAIDPTFGLPAPPRDTPYFPVRNLISMAFSGVVGFGALAFAAVDSRRTRTLLPVMVALSGAAICLPEALVDVLGGVYMADGPYLPTFTILGRQMGLYILIGWLEYGALFGYLSFKVLQRRPKTKTLWLLLLGASVGDIFFEEILVPLGSYIYYGNQPLVVLWSLGWWWIPCNAVGVFLAAALAHRYRRQLRGWKAISMLLITPMSVGGVYGFIALPSFIAVNANFSWLVTQCLGLLTIAMGVVVFAVILDIVLGRRPFALHQRPLDEVAVPAPFTTVSVGSDRDVDRPLSPNANDDSPGR